MGNGGEALDVRRIVMANKEGVARESACLKRVGLCVSMKKTNVLVCERESERKGEEGERLYVSV